ncbi:MAG: M56 family metallopeptidase, partial [Isosphaeraceae bacterium]
VCALCRELAARMGVQAPRVLLSPFLASPCLDGVWQPCIFLPEDGTERPRDTLVHELAHLARHDGVWNLLRRVTALALWVQPLFWMLARRLERAAEEVCDDHVVQFGADRASYAAQLVSLASRSLPPRAATAVGMISLRSMLARRVARILNTSRSLSTRMAKGALAVVLAIGFAGTVCAGMLGAGAEQREAKAQAPPKAAAHKADVPITGRIVDLEGRPVAGVSVKVKWVRGPKSGDLTPWIEAVKNGEWQWTADWRVGDYRKVPGGVRREATTDNDGRFRLEGFGAERVISLTIKGDTIACTSINVVTRKIDPIPARGFLDMYGPGPQSIHGADFTYKARPSRPIEGVVLDAKTKQPIAGVSVESFRFAGSTFTFAETLIRDLKTVADGDGHFRIVGMPRAKGNVLIAVPKDGEPYFAREVDVDDPQGNAPVRLTIELHRGLMISGKITDKATGKPVSGARLYYLPLQDNAYVGALPEFNTDAGPNGFLAPSVTRADGTYRLVGMPGHAIVGVASFGKTPYRTGVGAEKIKGMDKNGHFPTWYNRPKKGVLTGVSMGFVVTDANGSGFQAVSMPLTPGKTWPNTLVEINPPEGTESLTLDAQLDPGQTLRIKVVDPQGQPLPDASVAGGQVLHASYASDEGMFNMPSFRHDEVRNIVIRHHGRKLGKVVRLRAGDDAKGPVVVTLEPLCTIKARAVDAAGQPVPGSSLRLDVKSTEGYTLTLANVGSDREGRFEIVNVPAGCEYHLEVNAGMINKDLRFASAKAQVKPGETTDVGDIALKNR